MLHNKHCTQQPYKELYLLILIFVLNWDIFLIYGCMNETNASFNALPYMLDDVSGGTSDLVPEKSFRHPVFQVMYSTYLEYNFFLFPLISL